MSIRERTGSSDAVIAARERYVARGIAAPPLVVAGAEGARIEDAEGRTYIDFAGGLGCQNTGHGLPTAAEAIREQLDLYLHQCFMVGMYEPYVEVCRLLPMLALELTEPTPDLARAVTTTAREKGLILLSCGLYGNVIRILVPLVVSNEELARGLELLEESLVEAGAAGALG